MSGICRTCCRMPATASDVQELTGSSAATPSGPLPHSRKTTVWRWTASPAGRQWHPSTRLSTVRRPLSRGIAGRETMAALDAAVYGPEKPDPPAAALDPDAQPSEFWLPDLQLGDKDPAVTLLQAALNIRGFDCGSPDGIFGPKTQAALNRFKESRKMEQNGIADRETWNKILGVIA